MKIFYRGRDNQFDAQGIFEDGVYTVLKGSRISDILDNGLCEAVIAYRKQENLISNEQILMENITFSSASAAAQFVSGHVTNGLRAWKNSEGTALGKIVEGKTRKKRKNI